MLIAIHILINCQFGSIHPRFCRIRYRLLCISIHEIFCSGIGCVDRIFAIDRLIGFCTETDNKRISILHSRTGGFPSIRAFRLYICNGSVTQMALRDLHTARNQFQPLRQIIIPGFYIHGVTILPNLGHLYRIFHLASYFPSIVRNAGFLNFQFTADHIPHIRYICFQFLLFCLPFRLHLYRCCVRNIKRKSIISQPLFHGIFAVFRAFSMHSHMHYICLFLPKIPILQSFLFCTCCDCFFANLILCNPDIKSCIYNLVIFICNTDLRHIIDIKTFLQCICQAKLFHCITFCIHICTHQKIKRVIFLNTKSVLLICTGLCFIPACTFFTYTFFYLRFIHRFISKTSPYCFRLFRYCSYSSNFVSRHTFVGNQIPGTNLRVHRL